MNKLLSMLLAFTIGVILLSVVDKSEARAIESDSIRLSATKSNVGKIGKAMIYPQGNITAIDVQLSGVPDSITTPVHLSTHIIAGTCASHEDKVGFGYAFAYDLLATANFSPSEFEGSSVPMINLKGSIPADFHMLHSSPYSLSVWTSATDGNVEIFCGDNSASFTK